MRPVRRAIVAGLAVTILVGAGLVFSPAILIGAARSALDHPLFPLLLAGLYLVRPLLACPISALSLLVGYRYGVVVGLPIAMGGMVGTTLVPYAVTRLLRTDVGLLGRATDGSERYFEATGDLRGVIAARLAPIPAELVSSSAGLGRVPVRAYVLGTAIGELPWTVAAVSVGASLQRLAPSGAGAVDLRLAVLGLAAGLVLLAGPIYRFAGQRYTVGATPGRRET